MGKRSAAEGRAGRLTPSLWVYLAVGLAVLLVLAIFWPRRAAPPPGRQAEILAPDFELTVYQGAEVLGFERGNFSQIFAQGKPVVLNFWAGLCPPCRAEMPDFERVYRDRRDEFLLFGLDVGPFVGLGSSADGQALLRELAITYPTGTPLSGSPVRDYQVRGMPTTVFLTPDGRIFATHTGALTASALNQMIDRLLATSSSRPPPLPDSSG